MADGRVFLQRETVDVALKSIINHPLMIIAAPMGYGKTSAVRQFLENNQLKYMWLTLNEASSDHGYFWNSLTDKIAEKNPQLGDALQGMGFPSDNIQAARIIDFLMLSAREDDIIMVLDDYHIAADEELDHLLEVIVQSCIPKLHLLVISRQLPVVNLTALLVKNLVVYIDASYFRFSNQDVAKYFFLLGFPLTREEVGLVQKLAGGWVSALYLIYRGLKSGMKLSNITIAQELLKTAIYEQYDGKTQRVLYALSVLGEFTTALADYAIEIDGLTAIMRKLCQENAFIQTDNRTGVYSIHSVLSNFLRAEAPPADIDSKEICRLAGRWYLEHNKRMEAFRYLFRGEDYDRLLTEMERPYLYISAGDRPMLLNYFDNIPYQHKESHPIACLKFIMLFVITGNTKKGAQLLSQFEKDLAKKEISPARKREIEAEIHVVKNFLSFNNLEVMLGHVEVALELLSGGVSVISSIKGPFSFGSPHFSYLYYREPGTYKKTVDFPIEKYAVLSNGCGLGAAALSQAEYALETGNLAVVEGYAKKAVYMAKTKKQSSLVVCASLTLSRLYLLQDRYSEAELILKQLAEDVSCNVENILLNTYDLCLGYFYACSGEYERIPHWISDGDMSVNRLLMQGTVFSYVVYGKALILSENWLRAEALCETFIQHFNIFHNQLGHIHNYIHLAIAVYKQGDAEKAGQWLKCALEIGQADNIILPFAENGVNLLPLLLNFISDNDLSNSYLLRIIDLCRKYTEAIDNLTNYKTPLSLRETEVLSLMARGMSRAEIANQIFISPGTVRTHIQNIYKKLGVNKKSTALQKATEMKIIP